ncbi:hypothetical protein MLD38_004000 [Melastoma candidum]|uniref:Uncharacterized protein n=1 Tax=Melastoma candidum TaxID=119954 RepID=A0ACB9S8Y5_9MYRT|nr:hypothetical protein MLD38_004000 [Melastoma candidum]
MGCFRCAGKSSDDEDDARGNTRRTNGNKGDDHHTSERHKANDGNGENGKLADANKDEGSKHTQVLIDGKEIDLADLCKDGVPDGSRARRFSFEELVAATGNFRSDCFLGEGGFGKVFKGYLSDLDQEVAIKQLDPNGLQGTKEFIVEVTMLSMVDHPNLVRLIGFCTERDQKLLVYEYMPLRSLEAHLHGRSSTQ